MIFGKVGKTRDQWGKMVLYTAVAAGCGVIGSKFPVLGQYTGILAASAFGTPLMVYAGRVSRYFQNVRFKVPKYIKTGDGGDNYYSVIMAKYWNPFWVAPIDHIKLPINAFEVCIDAAGNNAGCVYAGKRPLSSISSNEKKCLPIPSSAKVAGPAADRYITLKDIDGKTDDEELELEALELFMLHGVEFD